MNQVTFQLNKIPTDVLSTIGSYLQIKDLGVAARVCKQWKTLLEQDYMWAPHCQVFLQRKLAPGKSWKANYLIWMQNWQNFPRETLSTSTFFDWEEKEYAELTRDNEARIFRSSGAVVVFPAEKEEKKGTLALNEGNLAIVYQTNGIKIWDIQTKQLKATFNNKTDLQTIKFKGHYFSAIDYDYHLKIWDVHGKDPIFDSLVDPKMDPTLVPRSYIHVVHLHANKDCVVAVVSEVAMVYFVKDQRSVAITIKEGIKCVALDKNWLILGSHNKTVSIYDLFQEKLINEIGFSNVPDNLEVDGDQLAINFGEEIKILGNYRQGTSLKTIDLEADCEYQQAKRIKLISGTLFAFSQYEVHVINTFMQKKIRVLHFELQYPQYVKHNQILCRDFRRGGPKHLNDFSVHGSYASRMLRTAAAIKECFATIFELPLLMQRISKVATATFSYIFHQVYRVVNFTFHLIF